MLRKALMKDHEMDQVKDQEMNQILAKFSKMHVGKDNDGIRLTKLYLKGKKQQIEEIAVKSMTIDIMRDMRKV